MKYNACMIWCGKSHFESVTVQL